MAGESWAAWGQNPDERPEGVSLVASAPTAGSETLHPDCHAAGANLRPLCQLQDVSPAVTSLFAET